MSKRHTYLQVALVSLLFWVGLSIYLLSTSPTFSMPALEPRCPANCNEDDESDRNGDPDGDGTPNWLDQCNCKPGGDCNADTCPPRGPDGGTPATLVPTEIPLPVITATPARALGPVDGCYYMTYGGGGNFVNIRSAPSTHEPEVTRIPSYNAFLRPVSEPTDGWVKVEYEGEIGWVSLGAIDPTLYGNCIASDICGYPYDEVYAFDEAVLAAFNITDDPADIPFCEEFEHYKNNDNDTPESGAYYEANLGDVGGAATICPEQLSELLPLYSRMQEYYEDIHGTQVNGELQELSEPDFTIQCDLTYEAFVGEYRVVSQIFACLSQISTKRAKSIHDALLLIDADAYNQQFPCEVIILVSKLVLFDQAPLKELYDLLVGCPTNAPWSRLSVELFQQLELAVSLPLNIQNLILVDLDQQSSTACEVVAIFDAEEWGAFRLDRETVRTNLSRALNTRNDLIKNRIVVDGVPVAEPLGYLIDECGIAVANKLLLKLPEVTTGELITMFSSAETICFHVERYVAYGITPPPGNDPIVIVPTPPDCSFLERNLPANADSGDDPDPCDIAEAIYVGASNELFIVINKEKSPIPVEDLGDLTLAYPAMNPKGQIAAFISAENEDPNQFQLIRLEWRYNNNADQVEFSPPAPFNLNIFNQRVAWYDNTQLLVATKDATGKVNIVIQNPKSSFNDILIAGASSPALSKDSFVAYKNMGGDGSIYRGSIQERNNRLEVIGETKIPDTENCIDPTFDPENNNFVYFTCRTGNQFRIDRYNFAARQLEPLFSTTTMEIHNLTASLARDFLIFDDQTKLYFIQIGNLEGNPFDFPLDEQATMYSPRPYQRNTD